MQQSPSSKIRESKLWNTKKQSGRGFNLAATSAPGHVTTLLSAAPKLDSTPINKLTDDKRSVVPTAQSSHITHTTVHALLTSSLQFNDSLVVSDSRRARPGPGTEAIMRV